ncbi:MAG: hypothetical protein EA380_07725 [Phycisphaeraceae bacterium]|nr:MAG: hypothetical protein EA380_07725 [Phycisphaeraceae bacterium]
MKYRLSILLLVAGVMMLIAPVASAQRDGAPRPGAQAAEADQSERVVARLEHRLQELEREQKRVREAIARLKQGESPSEVLPDLQDEPRGRPGGDRTGPPAQPGPRERGREAITFEDFLAMVRERRPEFAERLEAIRDRDPEKFDRHFQERNTRWRELVALYDQDPDSFDNRMRFIQIESEIQQTARRARAASEADREKAIEALRTLVAEQFDLRRSTVVQQHQDAKEYLARVEASLERIDASREDLIERRVQGLLTESREMERPRRPASGESEPERSPRRSRR